MKHLVASLIQILKSGRYFSSLQRSSDSLALVPRICSGQRVKSGLYFPFDSKAKVREKGHIYPLGCNWRCQKSTVSMYCWHPVSRRQEILVTPYLHCTGESLLTPALTKHPASNKIWALTRRGSGSKQPPKCGIWQHLKTRHQPPKAFQDYQWQFKEL